MEKHYRVVAKLSRKYGLAWANEEGARTYLDVFAQRDFEDRFVILYDQTAKKYLLVDMWDTTMDQQTAEIYMPEPLIFPTEDAAVMAARIKL